ncbi:hypothetical protein ACVGVM_03570 [Pseudonocardia bannensis]|uniref:Hemolysin type calcium-binding protein n=1 Tax=Pseudonocardia bannensis TaxID=630973 RepID=A0A848DKI6_9PSEU|nr:hypothetical protein [Pseudonocardia bannensis]NMH92981.1 hypothetical protein [Pseudonocardia bannensis]
MKPRATIAALVGALTAAGVGIVTGVSGGTLASFSDTVTSSPTTIGAATVVLGRGGDGPDLRYKDLSPGRPQTVELTVGYEGSIPADLSLSLRPGKDSDLCERGKRGWKPRDGAAATLTVGSAEAVNYCSLYDGRKIELTEQAPPGSTIRARITLALSADAGTSAFGRSERAVVTVHADGGFTDRAEGGIRVDTELGRDSDGPRDRSVGQALTAAAPEGTPGAVVTDPVDPGAAARSASGYAAIELPSECAAAGMAAGDFTEVVPLDPTHPQWNAGDERGLGAGPFLILGTAGDDTIVGSEFGDCIVGGAGNDTVTGGPGNDVVIGGPGVDVLLGDGDGDLLHGGPGHDDLRGGDGADLLDGGPSRATCDVTSADRATNCLPPPAPASRPDARATPAPVDAAQVPAPEAAPVATAPSSAPPPEPAPGPETAPARQAGTSAGQESQAPAATSPVSPAETPPG